MDQHPVPAPPPARPTPPRRPSPPRRPPENSQPPRHPAPAGDPDGSLGPDRTDDPTRRPRRQDGARPGQRRPAPAERTSALDSDSERGLRSLVGAGATQVSVSAALRARDACQPSPADLAAAERDLRIVQRGWRPDTTLPGYRA